MNKTQKELEMQNARLRVERDKVNENLAFLNLLGSVCLGGIGYMALSKVNKDYVTRGIMWFLGLWLTNIIVVNFPILAFPGLAVYIYMWYDTFQLKKKAQAYNQSLYEQAEGEVVKKPVQLDKEEVAIDKVASERATKEDMVKSAPNTSISNPSSDKEINDMIISISNQRVVNGYEPLDASQIEQMRNMYKGGE